MLSLNATTKGISLQIEIENKIPLKVITDSSRLL